MVLGRFQPWIGGKVVGYDRDRIGWHFFFSQASQSTNTVHVTT